ncbi:hypothetical protein F5B22DRAFT_598593 [Xylaria bambusicola]|uniref:uncharacterized protein n=1 Tax=Xylaria bambusicola TaxID=326684 RepID=UPI0020089026|nr:uncharacterized protein F5B22DRAFT_598593 [Xylaria bambusicola]KAI0520841.1 hypothetical protein F5B22DRAFT_598593 [Xylaria bambusicola]
MLDVSMIQHWVESIEPVDRLPGAVHTSSAPDIRPTKRARYDHDNPVSSTPERRYDPALFDDALQTPPETTSMQTTGQKRRGDGIAKGSESGSTVSELQHRSLPPPKPTSRRPSPVRPSLKTAADLELLDKPVFTHEIAAEENVQAILPDDVQSLYVAIENAATHQEEIIPKEVRDQVSRLVGENATRPRFFRSTETVGGTLTAEVTLARLRDIVDRAKSSAEQGRHETAWNHLVHTPMLDLAFRNNGPVGVEPAMTANIAMNSVPRLRPGIGAGYDTAPLPAWSAPHSNSVTLSENSEGQRPDSQQQGNIDRKKVDYVLVADVADPKMKTVIHEMVWDLGISGCGTHFNQTEYLPLRYKPIAVTIETKGKSSTRDPLLQLGIWIAAWHERMLQVRTFRSQAVKLTAEERKELFSMKLVSVPLIVITSYEWGLYFACDHQSSIEMYGPISIGSTRSLLSAYALLTSLEAIGTWIDTKYCASMKKWILVDKS